MSTASTEVGIFQAKWSACKAAPPVSRGTRWLLDVDSAWLGGKADLGVCLKISTWNVAGGDKRAAVDALDCDIALLQERRRQDVTKDELWWGDVSSKGLSARATSEYQLTRTARSRALPRYFAPMQVGGRESFQLISVWAMPDRPHRYVRGIVRAVDLWARRIKAQPTVIAGDFNANACWDEEHPLDRSFSALARKLGELGLVSAYHHFFGEAFASETRPTFFLYRHENRPYHMDYCFIPRAWLPRLRNVTVGRHPEWSRWSDHMPLTVEVVGGSP